MLAMLMGLETGFVTRAVRRISTKKIECAKEEVRKRTSSFASQWRALQLLRSPVLAQLISFQGAVERPAPWLRCSRPGSLIQQTQTLRRSIQLLRPIPQRLLPRILPELRRPVQLGQTPSAVAPPPRYVPLRASATSTSPGVLLGRRSRSERGGTGSSICLAAAAPTVVLQAARRRLRADTAAEPPRCGCCCNP